MKTKFLISLPLLLFTFMVQAQNKGLQFQSLLQGGLLEGAQGSAWQLQLVEGVSYKTWSAGIGAGLDYYHTRTVPLFLDVRKAVSGKGKTAFVYASGGYNLPWLREQDKLWLESDAKGGLYYDAGVGYQLPILKKSGLVFSAGYSSKKFSRMENTMSYLSIWPPPPQAFQENKYVVRRLSVKAGLRF